MWFMDQTNNNTPSKLSTRYFPPNKWQIRSAVKADDRYVPRRRRLSALYFVLLVIASGLVTYALVRWLG